MHYCKLLLVVVEYFNGNNFFYLDFYRTLYRESRPAHNEITKRYCNMIFFLFQQFLTTIKFKSNMHKGKSQFLLFFKILLMLPPESENK